MIEMIKALKACRFAGENYSAGDIVPEHAVDSKALSSLARMKILELVEEKVKPKKFQAEEIFPLTEEKPKKKSSKLA